MEWFFLIIAVLAFSGWVTAYVYLQCFHSPTDRKDDPYQLIEGEQYDALADVILECTRVMDKAPCEHVYISSHDGLKLHARYYHTKENAPTMIVMHGYKGNALRDGAGGFALSRQLDFNILVPDQRAHAKSQGNVITFGVLERYDCMRWIEYVNERFGKENPVVLSGISMGAATILMTTDLHLPSNVVGIMADCPYASPAGIICKVCTDRGFPEKFVFPFISLAAKLLGKFSITESTPAESVKQARIPILLIHGDDDRFVPCQMSCEIAANCAGSVDLQIFPGAGHGLAYMTDPERYEAVVLAFLRRIPQIQPYMDEGKL
ncbi:MAG: alpha/beta hydrolase [Ruminococcaceae bacterium]|nr:alpha/beta hydrolase [Oscillospiraceae bacterium]